MSAPSWRCPSCQRFIAISDWPETSERYTNTCPACGHERDMSKLTTKLRVPKGEALWKPGVTKFVEAAWEDHPEAMRGLR